MSAGTVGWLPADAEELFGTAATAEESYDVLTVDVPPESWLAALTTARDRLGCTYFDWLSAVDEPGVGFRIAVHVAALGPVRRLLVRTTVPHDAPVLPSAVAVYAGAAWHERETHEMFGVGFEGHPNLDHLLLPDTFEGHPLRKDFVLAARVAKAWPGAKEPGESEHGGPKRRQMLPPGVPDPNEWGPLKGQLPPAPARPARTGRAAGAGAGTGTGSAGAGRAAGAAGAGRAAAAAGERPARRMRTASEGSASQAAAGTPETAGTDVPEAASAASARPRRTRSASEGSASQAAPRPAEQDGDNAVAGPADAATRKQDAAEGDASRAAAEGPAAEASVAHEPGRAPARPRRARSASQGSASQQTEAEQPTPQEPTATESTAPESPVRPGRRSSDAPWHHARPAFDEAETQRAPETQPASAPEPERETQPKPAPEPEPATEPAGDDAGPAGKAAPGTGDGAEAGKTGGADEPQDTQDARDPHDTEDPHDPAGGPQ
ncbi:NADH-quinone oxidoreductase subunit C [Streptomyces sp. NPDC049915]|uniref:NADH-quinone oxidoreductase subunit C n=1 Tax=Streptomyces sp. NPDC049915 TaxID=3155510 RepID=UPI00342C74BC